MIHLKHSLPCRFEWVVPSNFGSRGTDGKENSPRRARRTRRDAQLLTYMRLAGVKTGLLMNFNLCGLGSPQLAATVACCKYRHSGACRNPVVRPWTPAFAGVT